MENGHHRVVVTGVGMVSPLGQNTEESWANMLAGQSGFTTTSEQYNIEGIDTGGVCEVKGWDPNDKIGRKDARRMDRYQQFVMVAAREAMAQSGLKITDDNRQRVGVFTGTGVGGVTTLVGTEQVRVASGPRRVSPFAIPRIMPNGAAGLVAIDMGAQGPCLNTTTACAAGNDGVGNGFLYVRHGLVDAAIVGGSEAPIIEVTLAAFSKAGALSKRTEGTPSPFDKDRDGFIAAEGAGMLVIETLEHAQARGAHILAELVGFGQTCDAYHITAPSENGEGAIRAMKQALDMGGIKPSEVSYINAHGTGTPLNDSTESKAIKTLFGETAYNIPVSSTKSMTGHGMGATGAIESIICTMAIRDQKVPPTINLVDPDPVCDLDYVSEGARDVKVEVASNNAFGFGGHNSVLVFKKFNGSHA
ncbi:MAG: beta-ketoacyl-ACP synthase II [Chloroflexota bacterium]